MIYIQQSRDSRIGHSTDIDNRTIGLSTDTDSLK